MTPQQPAAHPGLSPAQARLVTELRQALADELYAAGAITHPIWHAAFATVPRHVFVPHYYDNTPDGSRLVDATVGETWLRTVYSDTLLVTRDDVTSSSTAPSLMATMLEALDLTELNGDERVLEIGTGTGYNAALMGHVLGDKRVVSIDIDPDLIAAATERLATIGQHPSLIAGDGAAGASGRAPYDRIIATCRLDHIPAAWLTQTSVGGIIVTPLGAGIARLTNHGLGHAAGTFLPGPAYFMPLRHRSSRPDRSKLGALIETARTAPGTSARDHQYDVSIYRNNNARFWLDLTQPDVSTMCVDDQAIAYHPDGAWARLGDGTVTQGGPRNLWDDIEANHREWVDAGQPTRDRYALTITDGTLRIQLADRPTPIYTVQPQPART